jgi:hypothetical protein
VHIGIVEDVIAQLTEIPEIITLVGEKEPIVQFSIPDTPRGFTDAFISIDDLGNTAYGHGDHNNDKNDPSFLKPH